MSPHRAQVVGSSGSESNLLNIGGLSDDVLTKTACSTRTLWFWDILMGAKATDLTEPASTKQCGPFAHAIVLVSASAQTKTEQNKGNARDEGSSY